jgi:hypothetical protein
MMESTNPPPDDTSFTAEPSEVGTSIHTERWYTDL